MYDKEIPQSHPAQAALSLSGVHGSLCGFCPGLTHIHVYQVKLDTCNWISSSSFQFSYLYEPKQFYAPSFSIGGRKGYMVSPLSVYPEHIFSLSYNGTRQGYLCHTDTILVSSKSSHVTYQIKGNKV